MRNKAQIDQAFITDKGGSAVAPLLQKYTYRVTDTIRVNIHGSLNNDPVAKQYIPQAQELKTLPEERADPIGDEAHSPIKGIVHRYPDRVLFKPAHICAVYCRYCFRREAVGAGAEVLNTREREDALDYIRNHSEIFEVILTGGDPLVLSARQLQGIIQALNEIDHVKVIRIHTRVPIADPARITDEVLSALKSDKALYMPLHVNHAQELGDDTRCVLSKLHNAGINLLSQSVLLKGVNDDAKALETLYRALIALNVKPYYLHHPDLAPGTSHFRISIADGQEIMRALLGRLSGLCQPTYMLDIPGGAGKVPLTPCYIEPLHDNSGYHVFDYQGGAHIYTCEAEGAA